MANGLLHYGTKAWVGDRAQYSESFGMISASRRKSSEVWNDVILRFNTFRDSLTEQVPLVVSIAINDGTGASASSAPYHV